MNQELSGVQTGLREGRGTRDSIANINGKYQQNSRKTSTSASLTMLKTLTVLITTN